MNNDLISRAELMERIKQLAKDIARENGGVDHVTYAMKVAFDIVKDTPAVDAEPVRHGEWNTINDGRGGELLECSNCRYTFRRLFPRYYCPNCGAKWAEAKK